MKVPLLDLKLQYKTIKDEVLEMSAALFESQYFIMGPRVEKLEEQISAYCQSPYSVGVSSGTDAILLSLMTFDVGPGDLVITTPYTFFATAGCIARVGATPIFVDIDPHTFNISPQLINEAIDKLSSDERSKLKAIIPVHLYGQTAAMAEIQELAKSYNLTIIEDAAQAIGAEYRGKRAGSLGDVGCFSFFPSKNLGAFGDGGIVTVTSEAVYEKMKILRVHGGAPKYYHRMIGGNFRLDAFQAAVVSIKLQYLDGWTKRRNENAKTYADLFADANLQELIKLPQKVEDRHIYNQFVIMLPKFRDELKKYLIDAGVGVEIYYPVPLHLQDCFKYLGYQKNDFPVSEACAEKSLALPIYPELEPEQLSYVVDKIKGFFKEKELI